MELTKKQLGILRHMLGIDVNDTPNPNEYRNYYCANPGDEELHSLDDAGMVECYATRGGYEWWRTTEAGKVEARKSQRAILLPKPKRVYRKYLSISDLYVDLTFWQFLTGPEFSETRRSA